MEILEALEIVYELAQMNIIEPEPGDEMLEVQRKRQQTALDTVHDHIVNCVADA